MSLSLTNVDVVYAGVIQVLRSANLEVPEGKIVVLLGSNGAGKTTTLRAISGLLRAELGEVTFLSKIDDVEKLGQKISQLIKV